MRKDVKVGLASGGVLLAVIAVYTSSLNKQPTPNKGGKSALTLTGTSTDTAGKRSAGSITIESTGEPERSVAVVPTANTAVAQAAQGEPDWGRLLDTGAPPALMTRTLGPGEGKPSDAQRTVDVFADSTTSAKATVVGTPDANAAGGVSTAVLVDPARPSPTTPTLGATAVTPTSSGVTGTTATAGTFGTTPSATPGMQTYVIKSGDSFYTIARDLYGNSHFYPHISRANPDLDSRKIRPGMTINVPDAASVKPVATTVTTGTPSANTLMASAPSTANPSTPTATTGVNEYRVGANDNLYRIAVKLYGSPKKMQEIYELNKATIGEDPSKLKLNMILKLPAGAKTSG